MAGGFDRQGIGTAGGAGTGWMIASGVVLAVAGIAALLAPGPATLAVSIFIGWLLLLMGVAGLVMAWKGHGSRRWVDVAAGAVSIAIGVLVLFNPLAGALSLTLAVAFWLGVRGVVELVAGVRAHGSVKGLFIVTGAIDLLLAVLLFTNYPFPAVQMIGLFVGVSFLVHGAFTVAAALRLRRG